MKNLFLLIALIATTTILQAKPANLYEQLCEVNQEWYKNYSIAEDMGFLDQKPIEDEQELLVFHIQTLEKIFLTRSANHLKPSQIENRAKHLKVLNEYWKRRDCPKNYYLTYRNPVFIDHEGRYCAVGYLMLKSGKQNFCEAVQKNSNFIYIRQIDSDEFSQWQSESGLSLDELAWIQPGYQPVFTFAKWNAFTPKGKPIELDSLKSAKLYAHYSKTNPDSPKSGSDDTTFIYETGTVNRIFWGMRMTGEVARKSIKYQGDANLNAFDKVEVDYHYGLISAITLFDNELYVAIDSTESIFVADTFNRVESRAYILKWNNKSSTWDVVNNFNDETKIVCFFVEGGRLYAGGGKEIINTEGDYYDIYVSSYLACLENNTFKKVNKEYGGYIFGLVEKGKEKYLGTVINYMAGQQRITERIETTENSATEK